MLLFSLLCISRLATGLVPDFNFISPSLILNCRLHLLPPHQAICSSYSALPIPLNLSAKSSRCNLNVPCLFCHPLPRHLLFSSWSTPISFQFCKSPPVLLLQHGWGFVTFIASSASHKFLPCSPLFCKSHPFVAIQANPSQISFQVV